MSRIKKARQAAPLRGKLGTIMRFVLSWCLVSVIAFSATGATYYVDAASGNDANTGTTLETAWKTIGKANSALRPGDTVCVKGGVYKGQQIAPTRSGTAEARITYTACEGETPEVTGGAYGALVFLRNKSYVTISGFKFHSPEEHDWTISINGNASRYNRFENCEVTDPKGYVLVVLINGACYNEVTGCEIHGSGNGNQESGDGIVMNYGAHHNTISNNKVYNCCHSQIMALNGAKYNIIKDNDLYSTKQDWAGAGVNLPRGADFNVVSGNRIHDLGYIQNEKCGIQIDSADNCIHHNVIYNVANWGISIQSYAFHKIQQSAERNLVANNTIYNTGRQGLSIISKGDCISANNRVANNIVVGSPGDWYGRRAWIMVFDTYHLAEPVKPGEWFGNVFENNCFFHREAGEADMILYNHKGPAVTWSVPELQKAWPETWKANRELAPGFIDPENGDFSLEPGSPLVGAGVDVGLPFKGDAPDIGAMGPVLTQ